MTPVRLVVMSLALALCVAPATAAEPALPPVPHLFLVPAGTDAAVALSATRARVVARYEAATLVEAGGADAARLERAGADRRDDMREVGLGGGSIDPATDRPPLIGKHTALTDRGLAVIQFVGPVKDAWRAAMEATGVRVVSYMAQNAYLVSGSGPALTRLGALRGTSSAVRAVIAYTPRDKLGAGVRAGGRVAVQTVRARPPRAGRASVRSGPSVGAPSRPRGSSRPIRTSSPSCPTPTPSCSTSARIRSSRATSPAAIRWCRPGRGTSPSSTASGSAPRPSRSRSTSTDSGVDKGVVPPPAGSHPDFFTNGNPSDPSRIDYAHEATAADADARDCGGHGTAVAGVVGGFNTGTGAAVEDAAGYQYGLGVAPRTRLGATKLFNCAGSFDVTTSLTALASSAYAAGARIANNSWGSAVGGAYNASSQELDAIVRDAQPGVAGNQELVEVLSAGNSGAGAEHDRRTRAPRRT